MSLPADEFTLTSGLCSRLRAAADRLDDLWRTKGSVTEQERIRGKREGVLLALSYTEEALREHYSVAAPSPQEDR